MNFSQFCGLGPFWKCLKVLVSSILLLSLLPPVSTFGETALFCFQAFSILPLYLLLSCPLVLTIISGYWVPYLLSQREAPQNPGAAFPLLHTSLPMDVTGECPLIILPFPKAWLSPLYFFYNMKLPHSWRTKFEIRKQSIQGIARDNCLTVTSISLLSPSSKGLTWCISNCDLWTPCVRKD